MGVLVSTGRVGVYWGHWGGQWRAWVLGQRDNSLVNRDLRKHLSPYYFDFSFSNFAVIPCFYIITDILIAIEKVHKAFNQLDALI